MACLSCCVISAEDFAPAYMRWEDHPARVDWEVVKDLGAGSFSQVVLARDRRSGEYAALKAIFLDEPGMNRATRAMLQQEGDILLSLHHPNIVACKEVVRNKRADVLVLEYLQGCNVLDGLHRLVGTYTERDAAGIFRQLASAVAYMHKHGVLHRDIKPENLVYAHPMNPTKPGDGSNGSKPAPAPVVKLVDLGMALRYNSASPEKVVLGSPGFVAPEIVLGGEHSPAMDVYAMGVLLFIMLVGRKPYNIAQCEKLQYARIPLAEAPGFKDPRWLDLSPDAKHLVMGMLAFNPKRRLTAAQVLEHEWVTTCGGRTLRPLGDDVALGAATVAEMRRLRFITGGVVGTQMRAADAAVAVNARRGRGQELEEGSTREHDAFVEELRRMQKREASTHGGLHGVARSIAAKSFKTVHDTGGSVHQRVLEGSVGRAALARPGGRGERKAAAPAQGMHRSGTSVMLSELVHDGSLAGSGALPDGGGGMRRSASTGKLPAEPSGWQVLGASIKQYLDVSIHGGRGSGGEGSMHGSLRMGTRGAVSRPATAQLAVIQDATAGGGGSGSGSAAAAGATPSYPLLKVVQVHPTNDSRRRSLDGRAAARSSVDGGSRPVPGAGGGSVRSDGSPGGNSPRSRRVVSLKPLE